MPLSRYLLLSLIYLLIVTRSHAQTKLTVQVKAGDGAPLERASVLLRHFAGGKTTRAAFTGPDGITVMGTDTGKYIISVTYTGLETATDTLFLRSGDSLLRTYTLIAGIATLQTVHIVGRTKLIDARDDRFIYRVAADSMARAKSVSQVLKNVPFVTVDGQGSVQVAGQGSYRVLVNGKETALFAGSIGQALKSFPADIVERIELIMSPGARYDAEGVTAIINIITKKKFEGYKGFAYAYLSDRSHFSDGLTLTAKTGRLGITVKGELDGSFNLLNGYKTTTTTPLQKAAYQHRMVSGKEGISNTNGAATVEVSYELDSLRSLVAYLVPDKKSTNNELDQQVTTLLADNQRVQGNIRMRSRERAPGLMAGLDYIQRGKSNPAKEIVLRFNWQGNSNRIASSTDQQYGNFTKWMENSSTASNDEFTLQADLVPVAKKRFTLETGGKAIIRRASADYISLFTYDRLQPLVKDPVNSNSFTYRQQVYAAYGSVKTRIRDANVRAGVRLESTAISGDFSNLSTGVEDRYFSVVPNVHISRPISHTSTLSIAYNLHLLRPYITSLNPYVNNVDSFNISYGNPSLGPQTVHKVVLQNRFNMEKLFFAVSLTGTRSNNKILAYRLFDAGSGVTHNTIGNVGREQMLSLALSGRVEVTSGFRAGFNGALRYVDVRNKMEDTRRMTGYSGVAAGNFDWDLNSRLNISGSGGVSVDDVSLLGRYTPYYFYQVNIGYHLIKDKLFATVNWNNVHAGYFTKRTIFEDNTVSSVTETQTVYRMIFVGLQYTFGNLRKDVAKRKGVSNDDLLK